MQAKSGEGLYGRGPTAGWATTLRYEYLLIQYERANDPCQRDRMRQVKEDRLREMRLESGSKGIMALDF